MLLIISKWGNSQGIRFPKDLLSKLQAKVGSHVNAEFRDGKIIIEPVDIPKKYDIHDLVKGINKKGKKEEFDWGKPEGNEVW